MPDSVKGSQQTVKVALLTLAALCAFAANTIFCRLALKSGDIDPAAFTVLRLTSGAAVLAFIFIFHRYSSSGRHAHNSEQTLYRLSLHGLAQTLALFIYAICFSFAYRSLDTGTGALILFGAVQLSMILTGLVRGGRLLVFQWLGFVLAFSGLVFLVAPILTSPSLLDFILMTVAGIAWGAYTLFGRGSKNPLGDTSFNFLMTIPLCIPLVFFIPSLTEIKSQGVVMALLSGVLSSGIGYTIWYAALPYLSAISASVLQLAVPILAAVGGIVFVGEAPGLRLILAGLMTLGGIYFVITKKPT